MPKLHMSKVAVGCASVQALEKRQTLRRTGDFVPILTRFRPKREQELIGGSIYWIIKHRIVARQEILGFVTSECDRRTVIRLDPVLIFVRACPKRAHQGWRYLEAIDAPADFDGEDDGIMLLPPVLAQRLAGLALI
jgi:hypothetical protein